ncbi:MAG TPA: MogA/MoaB family molybdenum cofactor biosynthesis protein [Acidimicrobiales bacterium]
MAGTHGRHGHGHAPEHGHDEHGHDAGPAPTPGHEQAGGSAGGGAPAAKVLTVSDGVVAGTREDRSGAALAGRLGAAGFAVVDRRVCADGVEEVAAALRDLADGFVGLVVTTGGTGFGPRDLTPEGTRAVLDREAPGLAEAMRLVNPLGRLSRATAGTLGAALVLNTPGSSSGAVECLEAVLDVVPHALDLLAGGRPH